MGLGNIQNCIQNAQLTQVTKLQNVTVQLVQHLGTTKTTIKK